MDSPFDVLGIDSDADEVAVVEAYREAIKQAHPDHGGSTDEFQRVRTAYEQILDGYVHDGDDTDGEGDDEGDAAEEEAAEAYRVEYLNYETLDDHGWTLHDDDLFEKASAEDLSTIDYGRFSVEKKRYLLESAEGCGFAWPYACRGGACANCAVAVVEGEMEMPSNHILSPEMMEQGMRLSCISVPTTDELKIVYNVKHLPGLDELRLPSQRFERAQYND